MFRHPLANREVRLHDTVVAYEFKRGQRRTIGFLIGPKGLAVRAPTWVSLAEVDAALQEKSLWILKKLGESQARQARVAAQCMAWHDGTRLAFLGESVDVRLDPQRAVGFASVESQALELEPNLFEPAATQADQPGQTLRLGLPLTATPDQIRDAVQLWLMRQARQRFIERLDHFAPLLQVQWHKLSLSNAATRWGSARTDGAIRLNWRLIHFKPSVIDYVVAHELSHLRVMNHSPRFWDTVRSVVPDYALLRGQLKGESVSRWA